MREPGAHTVVSTTTLPEVRGMGRAKGGGRGSSRGRGRASGSGKR